MTFRVLGATLLLVAGGTLARATDIPITGLKLIVVDKTASSGTAKAVFVAKDPAITKGAGTDTTQIFSELGVAYDGVEGGFEMPPGAAWVANKDTVAKYTNGDAPSGGAVKVSIIKPGLLVKVVGKSLGDTPLDISSAPVGDVYVAHSVLNGGEAFRHCTLFGGSSCIHKVIAGGTGYKLICKEASVGDPTCAGGPPAACCNLTDLFPLCTFLTPLTCASAGGTTGGDGSVCDSATGTCAGSATAGGCCEGIAIPFGTTCLAGGDMTGSVCTDGFAGSFSASAVCSPNGTCL